MPTFRYQSLGTSGSTATIDAPDRASAIRELVRRGVTPTGLESDDRPDEISSDLRPTRGMKAAGRAAVAAGVVADEVLTGGTVDTGAVVADVVRRSRSMSRAEVAMFIRELSTAVQAGLPMVQGLKTIARQGRRERQRAMLGSIIERVEHGRSLGDAMGEQRRTFGDLTANLVRAGEASGRLGEVLTQAADLLDRDVKLRRSVLAATLYPMILGVLIAVSVVILVTIIVPKILKPLAGRMIELPWPTRVVQGFAEFFSTWWWVLLPAAAVAVWAGSKLYRTPAFRLWFDDRILRVPVLGRLLRDVAVARFTRTLGTLVSAGIPAVNALKITKGVLGNTAMERVVEHVCEQVVSGKTIADPMEKSGLFPPMLVQIINLGERSGRLDQLLNQAASAFEDRSESSLKLFTTALPPVLVVMLACVVGFVVLSILLPLLGAQEALG